MGVEETETTDFTELLVVADVPPMCLPTAGGDVYTYRSVEKTPLLRRHGNIGETTETELGDGKTT